MKKEEFKKTSEFDYISPEGGWECITNVSHIVGNLLTRYPNVNIELDKKEFLSLMSVFGNEILVSILLDKKLGKRGLGINKIFREGFEFRGIRIRVA